MGKRIIGVIGLIIIVTFVAFTFPVVIDSAPGSAETTVTIDKGNDDIVTEYLSIGVEDSSNTEANITATNTRVGDTSYVVITEGTTTEIPLGTDTINVTNQRSTPTEATLTVEYSRSFGWDSSSDWFLENLGLLMVVLAFVSIMSGLVLVVNKS